jgi:hypothetical protein
MTTATTVLSAKELAQQIRYNACVRTFAKMQARGKAKEQIKARGDKVSYYSAREISDMAEVILAQNWDECLTRAHAWADDWKRRGWR